MHSMHLCHACSATHLVVLRRSYPKQLVDKGNKRRTINYKGYEISFVLFKCLVLELSLGAEAWLFVAVAGKYIIPIAEIEGNLPLPLRLN